MILRPLLFACLLITTAGCASQVPLAANHPLSTQKKARAVHHWDVLADDVTTQTIIAMRKANVAEGTPLFVLPPKDTTVFGRAFRSLLITRMVARGLTVRNEPASGAIDVQYETQLVRHNSSRYAHTPGSITALTSGIWVLRDMIIGNSSVMPAGLAISALADYGAGHFADGATPTELLITSSIARDNSYIMRKSDIYYIEDADISLFAETCKSEAGCDKELLTDPKKPVQRPLKDLKVR